MEINEKLQNFLSSTALVIDDEIVDEASTISGIISELERRGTLFIKRRELLEHLDSISNIAFLILDWDLVKTEEKAKLPEGVFLGEALLNDQKEKVRNFVKSVISRYFIPIFIFTRENVETIKSYLSDEETIKEAIDKNRIFISNKSSLENEKVITTLNDWLNNSMAVYTYKILEESIENAKHRFFNEMYACHPNWPCHVYQTLKNDNPADINADFQEFLMSSYTSTIDPIEFNHDGFDQYVDLDDTEILKIYSKIKFFYYKDEWKIGPHPGDIYKIDDNDDGNEFYINVSASCDMRGGQYYFIRGKTTEDFEEKICLYIIRKIMDKQAVCFDFRNTKIIKPKQNYNLISLGEKKNLKNYKRIGRLLSPYIDVLQDKFSQYITRTGVLRDPNV